MREINSNPKTIMLYVLCYVSKATGSEDEITQNTREIVKASKISNLKNNITGVLVNHKGYFLQIIEGESQDIINLIQKIQYDKRHEDLEILLHEKIEKRGFSDWSLANINLDENSDFDPKLLKLITNEYRKISVPESHTLYMFYEAMLKDGVGSIKS